VVFHLHSSDGANDLYDTIHQRDREMDRQRTPAKKVLRNFATGGTAIATFQ